MKKEPHFKSVSQGGCDYDYDNMTFDENSNAAEFHAKEKLKYTGNTMTPHLYDENLNLERWFRNACTIESAIQDWNNNAEGNNVVTDEEKVKIKKHFSDKFEIKEEKGLITEDDVQYFIHNDL